MNYCSIQEAWGNKKNTLENFSLVENTVDDNIKNKMKNESIDYERIDTIDRIRCVDIINHLNNCKKCQNIIKKKYKCNHNVLSKFLKLINENKDTIIIFLIGISILLFFNLIRNVR